MSLEATIREAQHYLAPHDVDCVVYHNPCNDGSGAALAAWILLGDKATYIPRTYHKEFDASLVHGKNVVVLDASFKKDELQQLRGLAHKIMILDHHDSAMKDLAGEPGCFFTMGNSGAVLSWHYFHGIEQPAPRLLQLIEDRDLWRWQERDLSEPLFYALQERASNSNFKTYEPFLDTIKLDELIAYGKGLIAANRLWCEQKALFAEHRIFNLPGTSDEYSVICLEVENERLVSELAEYLYTQHQVDFVMLWSQIPSGLYKISFRSNNPAVNVADIATALGGGGHPQAAGAVLDNPPNDLLEPLKHS
jgi:oligoribonuclease NrnB/cAMP/cGMP phosphodiesterase (DHH superfamily)